MEQTPPIKRPVGDYSTSLHATAASFWRRLCGRGESALASIALATATSLLAAMAACGWWTGREHRQTLAAAREEQLRTIGSLLSQNVESMLNADDLSGARRLLLDSARIWHLRECRIVLGTDQVLADADPHRINV